MPIVELPDKREIEFPEEASPEQIQAVLRRDFPDFFQPQPSFSHEGINFSRDARRMPESTIVGGPKLQLPDASVALGSNLNELGEGVQALSKVPGYVANIARAIPADVAAGASLLKRPEGATPEKLKYAAAASGNIPAAIMEQPLPIDAVISEAAKESVPAATAARLSQDLAATAPLAAVGLLPASAVRLITAGFTVDMIRHAPELFNQYAEEINKPKEEQDPNRLAELQSGIIQTFTMAPAAGAHGFGKPATEFVANVRNAFDNAKRLTPGEPNASSIPKTTEVHGALRPQPVEGEQAVPFQESGAGVQPPVTAPEVAPPNPEAIPVVNAQADAVVNKALAEVPPTSTKTEPVPPELGSTLNEFGKEYQSSLGLPPELRTPRQNYVVEYVDRFRDVANQVEEARQAGSAVDVESGIRVLTGLAKSLQKMKEGKFTYGSIGGKRGAVVSALKEGKPVNAEAVDFWGMKIPEGYSLEGDRYIYQLNRAVEPSTPPPTPFPESAAAASLGTEQPNVTTPVTEAQLSRGPGAAAAGEPGTYSAIAQLADKLAATAKENAPVDQKIRTIEKVKAKATDLKDGVKSALTNVLAIKKALWNSYAGLAPYTEMKGIVGRWFHANQKADFEAREFGKQIVKAVPDKLRREAITNWIQTDGNMDVLKQRAEASKGTLKQGYEIAQSLTPRELDIAQMLRDYYDQQLERGVSEGLLKDGLENYITQIWKRENPITRSLQNELVNSRLQPNFKFAKQRIFDSFFEGEQAGYKPMKDAGALVAHYDQSFNKALAARAFIKQLHEGTATDGRPLVEISGMKQPVDPDAPKPKIVIRPKATPEEIGDYKTIDHPALRGWKWIGKSETGQDILLNGELKVHPEIYAKLKNRLSTSWFRQNPAARAVLNTQSTLKQSMLSVSLFHQVQEGLHALGHRINPANLEKIDFSEPVTKSLVEHGLQLSDHNALEQFGEGLSSGNLLNKVPVLGPKLKAYNDWLFQEHIPRLKLTMAKHALERNMERYADSIKSGKISENQVLELTASQANHAFGELPYKYWGRNPNLQDFYRTFLLAPDFLEARAGFVGQAVKPGGLGPKGLLKNEQMQALALLALTQYITARVANQIIDQDPHWELKNAFRIISGNHAYSLRTIPGDIVHLMSDPRGFSYNRLSPIVGRGSIEGLTGRDYRGVKRDFMEQMQDMLKSGIPISLQRKNGTTILESFGNSMGLQNQRYDAVQNMQQKIADFKESQGIKDPYETIYSPEDDQYAALRLAIQSGRQAAAQAEFDKLKQTVKPDKIREHFKLSWSRPLTGSKALDDKFVKTLNEVGRMEWKEAQDLRAARIKAINSLR